MDQQQTSFPQFSRLPPELRLQIWRYSRQPRVVEVIYDSATDTCTSTAKPPALLHVCHESRHEGLRAYRKTFGTKSSPPSIYFDPSTDVLYLPRHGDMGYDEAARDFTQRVNDMANVTTLAIDHVPPDIRRPWEAYNKYCLIQSFPKLREAILVLGYEDEHRPRRRRSEMEFIEPAQDPAYVSQLLADVHESFCFEVFSETDFDKESKSKLASTPLVPKSKMIQSA